MQWSRGARPGRWGGAGSWDSALAGGVPNANDSRGVGVSNQFPEGQKKPEQLWSQNHGEEADGGNGIDGRALRTHVSGKTLDAFA